MRSGCAQPRGVGETPGPLSWHHTPDRQLTRAARGPLPDDVTRLAVADKGTFRVLTVPVEANEGIQVTLVHICGVTGEEAGEDGGGA